MKIELKPTLIEHLSKLYTFQSQKEGALMAAFTSERLDEISYTNKWKTLLINPTINCKTIYYNNTIVGSIAKYVMEGKSEITYWIDQAFWGKGIAKQSLEHFLKEETERPIYGHVAFDNIGSQKVLDHCGFKKVNTQKSFSNYRNCKIEEFTYILIN